MIPDTLTNLIWGWGLIWLAALCVVAAVAIIILRRVGLPRDKEIIHCYVILVDIKGFSTIAETVASAEVIMGLYQRVREAGWFGQASWLRPPATWVISTGDGMYILVPTYTRRLPTGKVFWRRLGELYRHLNSQPRGLNDHLVRLGVGTGEVIHIKVPGVGRYFAGVVLSDLDGILGAPEVRREETKANAVLVISADLWRRSGDAAVGLAQAGFDSGSFRHLEASGKHAVEKYSVMVYSEPVPPESPSISANCSGTGS